MSRLTDFLKLHIWEIPKDNNEKFNYTKAIADNFDKIDEGMKNAVSKFTEPLSYKGSVLNYENLPIINTNGDIYTVTSENKNYIWNGTTWEEYSSNIDLTPIEEQLKTIQITEVAEELSIPNTAPVNGKLDIKSGKSEQKTSTEGKNKCPTDFEEWETGHYSATGTKEDNSSRIRLIALKPVTPNTEYYFNTNLENYRFVVREYNQNKVFINSIGGLAQTDVKTTTSETYYLGISIYGTGSTQPTFEDYQTLFNNGSLKPFICLNNETDKTFAEFIPNSPSPDYPSDIRNVGDNIQLLSPDKFNNVSGCSINDKEHLVVNTTANTGVSNLVVYNNIGLTEDTYTISATLVKGTYNGKNVVIRNSSGTSIGEISLSNGKGNVTVTGNIKDIVLWQVQNTTNCEFAIKIEKGKVPTSPSEYGCGSVGVKAQNKNKFDKNTVARKGYSSGTVGAVINKTNSTTRLLTDEEIIVKPNTKHTFTLGTTKTLRYNIFEIDENNTIVNIFSVTTNSDKIFTTNANTKKVSVMILWQTTTNEITLDDIEDCNIQLEEGEKTSYVEPQEQTVVFPLSQGQLLHKGDYLADDGIHQNKVTIVLDGTEKWYEFSTQKFNKTNMYYMYTGFKFKSYNGVICSHFKYRELWDNDNEGIALEPINETNFRIRISNEKANSVEEFKTYLAEQYANGTPIIAECELAEEIIIPYTEEQKEAYYQLQHLLMYEGYTSIECIEEIKPDMQVTYSYNNEINTTYGKKIDTLEARIRQLEQMITSQREVVE